MKKIGLKAIKTRPHLIAKFPHLFQPGGGFPHFDQILDLTLSLLSDRHLKVRSNSILFMFSDKGALTSARDL